jgi:double-stranded uracil-DNA glycosylase
MGACSSSDRRRRDAACTVSSRSPLRDVIAPGLDVLFCGINPGLYSAATGHNFARPGNRFWPTIHRAGFTPRQLRPDEERELLTHGCGITNLVARATAAADELTPEELREGSRILERKVKRYTPRVVAFVGIGAYRTAFGRPRATVGLQEETIGASRIWLLPNPSGLNANYRPAELVEVYAKLRDSLCAL